jgi:hypothetical protein
LHPGGRVMGTWQGNPGKGTIVKAKDSSRGREVQEE